MKNHILQRYVSKHLGGFLLVTKLLELHGLSCPNTIRVDSTRLILALSLNFLKYRMTPGFTPGSTDDVWKRRKVVGI